MGKNFANSLGGTSWGWDDVLASTTAGTPIFATGAIDSLLGSSDGMDSGHQSFNDSKFFFEDLALDKSQNKIIMLIK